MRWHLARMQSDHKQTESQAKREQAPENAGCCGRTSLDSVKWELLSYVVTCIFSLKTLIATSRTDCNREHRDLPGTWII